MRKQKFCLDCKKPIHRSSIKCRACANKIKRIFSYSPEWLYDHYVCLKESSSQMAKIAGVSNVTIINKLKEANIPRRSREEVNLLGQRKGEKRLPPKECAICGRDYFPKSNRKGRKFCSLACGYKGRINRKNRKIIKCSNCGKEFDRPVSLLKDHRSGKQSSHFYCSHACQQEHYKKRFNGPKNPHWKGGRSTQLLKLRRGPGNRLYRKGVYYERKAKAFLESSGHLVIRSSGSKGAFDLVALNRDGVRLIQVKSNIYMRPSELKRMADFSLPDNVTREWWRYYANGKVIIYIFNSATKQWIENA